MTSSKSVEVTVIRKHLARGSDAYEAAEGALSCISTAMRFRIVLLFAFASLLGTPVLVHHNQRANACARIADPTICSAVFPDPFWVVPVGVLSLIVLCYAMYVLASAWAERRHEKTMLDSVGVHVREEDLPLEE